MNQHPLTKGFRFCSMFCICLIFLIIAISCDLTNDPQNNYGTLAFSLASDMNTRTLSPGISLEVATFDLAGTGPDDESFAVTDISSSSYVRYDLVAEQWSVVATARNASGDSIASATATTTIEARKTSIVNLTCLPIVGTGSLSLEVSWPQNSVESPQMIASLVPVTGTTLTIPFTLGSEIANGSLSGIPNGFHTLSIKLNDTYGTGKTVWGRVEVVQIITDLTTTGDWALNLTDMSLYQTGGIEATIDTSIPKPFTITIPDSITRLAIETSKTVTVVSSVGIDSVQWFLNGDPIEGATTESLTFGSDLPLV